MVSVGIIHGIITVSVTSCSRSVKRVRYQGSDRAENEGRKVKDARREDLGFSRREPRIGRIENWVERIDLEVFERIPTFIEFEPRGLILFGYRFYRRDIVGVGFR